MLVILQFLQYFTIFSSTNCGYFSGNDGWVVWNYWESTVAIFSYLNIILYVIIIKINISCLDFKISN
jgi:hypothetical protein